MGAFQLYFQEMYRDVSGRYPGMAMAELIQIVAEDYRNLDDAIKDVGKLLVVECLLYLINYLISTEENQLVVYFIQI
jgi:hypothetical protein